VNYHLYFTLKSDQSEVLKRRQVQNRYQNKMNYLIVPFFRSTIYNRWLGRGDPSTRSVTVGHQSSKVTGHFEDFSYIICNYISSLNIRFHMRQSNIYTNTDQFMTLKSDQSEVLKCRQVRNRYQNKMKWINCSDSPFDHLQSWTWTWGPSDSIRTGRSSIIKSDWSLSRVQLH
jgi:hypothetical protein